ncbi:MAG: response regulator [Desulfobacterales bacterium]|nr:response regulator [Desulfobacterales bacterium]
MTNAIKVLMVDDEEQFRLTTKRILSNRGFDVILAQDGWMAIKKLDQHPDVIILDIKLPDMDGHEVLKEIKKVNPEIPVIMLTGHAALPSARDALTEGAFDYLSKPCDIDLLAVKIHDAHRFMVMGNKDIEHNVADVMIPIEEYTTLTEDHTVKEAILKLKKSFSPVLSSAKIMETGHRSILVFGNNGREIGFLSIKDLLRGIMPAYLSAPKPSMADSIQFSPMFWNGLFNIEIKQLAEKKIGSLMTTSLLEIASDANLMEAAYMMVSHGKRRLIVKQNQKVVGVIREQDLFFEMERLLSK